MAFRRGPLLCVSLDYAIYTHNPSSVLSLTQDYFVLAQIPSLMVENVQEHGLAAYCVSSFMTSSRCRV
jgi:hypothetical protein